MPPAMPRDGVEDYEKLYSDSLALWPRPMLNPLLASHCVYMILYACLQRERHLPAAA